MKVARDVDCEDYGTIEYKNSPEVEPVGNIDVERTQLNSPLHVMVNLQHPSH